MSNDANVHGSAPTGESFTAHVARARELIAHRAWVEARTALEQALRLQPDAYDVSDLLASVHMELGNHVIAIDFWKRLVETAADSPEIRVRLGLALLKVGRPTDALVHMRVAVRQAGGKNPRLFFFLGLVLWRLGLFSEAREAFAEAPEVAWASELEEVLGAARETVSGRRQALRSAADQALEHVDAASMQVDRAHPASVGRWEALEPGGTQKPWPVGTAAEPGPPSLRRLVRRWETPTGPSTSGLRIAPSGDLVIHAAGAVFARADGVRAVQGTLRATVVPREEVSDTAVGDRPMLHWRGPVVAVVAPPAGSSFHALRMEGDDALYVREERVWAHDDSLTWETAALPLAEKNVVVYRFSGEGTVVLAFGTVPVAIAVSSERELAVHPRDVVGWIGRLFPTSHQETAPYSSLTPPLVFRGDGHVLVV